MRYKLIPARGIRHAPVYFEADSDDEAEYLAQRWQLGRVLLCAVPDHGIVRQVGFVGPEPEEPQKPKRR